MTETRECSRHAICDNCGRPAFAHQKRRFYPDDGPAGSYHYHYFCPGTTSRFQAGGGY
jgi:hypothetical protein